MIAYTTAIALGVLAGPCLILLGTYEEHAGRKGIRYIAAGVVFIAAALVFAWVSGRTP